MDSNDRKMLIRGIQDEYDHVSCYVFDPKKIEEVVRKHYADTPGVTQELFEEAIKGKKPKHDEITTIVMTVGSLGTIFGGMATLTCFAAAGGHIDPITSVYLDITAGSLTTFILSCAAYMAPKRGAKIDEEPEHHNGRRERKEVKGKDDLSRS